MQQDAEQSPAAKFGLAFALALVSGDFDAAYQMLAPALRDYMQPADLKDEYSQMTSYWTAPAATTKIVSVDGPDAFGPGKEPHDIAWLFIAIDSLPPDSFLEAVTVRVIEELEGLRIGQIVWGRP